MSIFFFKYFANKRLSQAIISGLTVLLLCSSQWLSAADRIHQYKLPTVPTDNMVGDLSFIKVKDTDTFSDIASLYGLGFDNLRSANPTVDPWLPKEGEIIVLPRLYILPETTREGIVVNIPEKRLYYFPTVKAGQQPSVEIYAVSVGRQEWNTPVVSTKVTGRVIEPTWYPPKSLRAEHLAQGNMYPRVVPPGPENPLGKYLLQLSIPTYFIHSTNNRFGIGMQVTRGCIRMFPEDIESIFNRVAVGTPVSIVNKTYKIGRENDLVYLEVNPMPEVNLQQMTMAIEQCPQDNATALELIRSKIGLLEENMELVLDWNMIERIRTEATGLPIAVGHIDARPATLPH